MNEIKLPNRYGYKVYLKHIEEDKWLFNGEDNAFEYHRLVYANGKGSISAVDPSGGPYLCIGYVIDNMTVTNIVTDKDKGYIVTLKPLHGETH